MIGDLIKMRILFFLIIISNIVLSAQDDKKHDPIVITPLYIPDEDAMHADRNKKIDQAANQQPIAQNTGSRQMIKPAEWILESSLKNAPKLLKGIFSYLQSRTSQRNVPYSVIIPSFHRFILVGPPGSGKTTLAHAIAHMLGYSTVFIPATSFLGRYRNETSIKIADFLEQYVSTKSNIVIIIDELHKLFEHHTDERSDHSQTAATFWLMLDKIEKYNPNIIVIGTANNVAKLPPEIKSRFSGKIITIPMPDASQKVTTFKSCIAHDESVRLDPSIDDEFIAKMMLQIDQCSLRDIRLLIDTAKMFYFAKKTTQTNQFPMILTKKHFQRALNQLATESTQLEESAFDKLQIPLRKWGMVFSVAVNIITLIKEAARFLGPNTPKNI